MSEYAGCACTNSTAAWGDGRCRGHSGSGWLAARPHSNSGVQAAEASSLKHDSVRSVHWSCVNRVRPPFGGQASGDGVVDDADESAADAVDLGAAQARQRFG